MMSGVRLGQFEAPMIIGSGHATNGICLEERRQVPVDAALGKARIRLEDLGDGQRASSDGQRVNQHATQPGITLLSFR